MADRPLRGVLIGLGTMGSYHLRVLSAHPEAELVALVDPSADRRAAATAQSQAPSFADLGEALSSVEADFACVATPVDHLPTSTHAALAADLAVMVEKPMAPTEAAAAAIVEDADARGQLLAVGHVERCNPAVLALRERLEAGNGGEIHQVHARRLSPYPGRESMTGVALDLATHDIDVIRYLTGSEVVRVYAETANRIPGGSEDLLSASLRLESGTTGVLEVNWLTPTKVRELTVTAEGGMFVVNYLTQDLTFYENPRASVEWEALRNLRGSGEGDMTRYAIPRREPLVVEWDRFLAAARGEGEPAARGADGLASLSVGRAIQASGAEHVAIEPGYRRLLA